MPRVTQHEQYERHLFLRRLWTDFFGQGVFADLNVAEQWKVHAFYQPDEVMDFTVFKEHLKRIKREKPELCHVAGKLYFRLQEVSFAAEARRSAPATPRPKRRLRSQDVVVRVVARPEPDIGKLIRAARMMAAEESKQAKDAESIDEEMQQLDDLN